MDPNWKTRDNNNFSSTECMKQMYVTKCNTGMHNNEKYVSKDAPYLVTKG